MNNRFTDSEQLERYVGGKDWYLFGDGDGTLELREILPEEYTVSHDPETGITHIVVTLKRNDNECQS
jgi:hypothetical protein